MPEGKTVLSAGADLTLRAWSPTTGIERWRKSFAQGMQVKFTVPDVPSGTLVVLVVSQLL